MLDIKKQINIKFEALATLSRIAEETERRKDGKKPNEDLLELSAKYGFTSDEYMPIVDICDFVAHEMAESINAISLYFHREKEKVSLLSFGTMVGVRHDFLQETHFSQAEVKLLETLLFLRVIGREDDNLTHALPLEKMLEEIQAAELSDGYKWRLVGLFSNLDFHIQQTENLMFTAMELIKDKLHEVSYMADYCAERLESGDTLLLSGDINIAPSDSQSIVIPSIMAYDSISWYGGFEDIKKNFGKRIITSMSQIFYGALVDKVFDKKKAAEVSSIENLFSYLKPMTDMTRLRILSELTKGSINGSEIAQTIGITRATVSYHMNELFQKKIIAIEKRGTSIFYSLNKQTFGQLVKIINDLFGS